jgi:hypothetical protein
VTTNSAYPPIDHRDYPTKLRCALSTDAMMLLPPDAVPLFCRTAAAIEHNHYRLDRYPHRDEFAESGRA